MRHPTPIRILAALGALAAAGTVSATPLFHVTDLGRLEGFDVALGGVNAAGVVVGTLDDQATVFDHGTVTPLGTFGGDYSTATQINDAGLVVGMAKTVHFAEVGFTWSGGALQPLPTLGGGSTIANAVNQAGWIAGTSTNAKGHFRAFTYKDGVMTDLGLPPHGSASFARGINEAGVVVGSARRDDGTTHGFLVRDGHFRDLGAGEGALVHSEAVAVNNHGQIAGTLYTGTGVREAVLFDETGTHPLLPGVEDAASAAINDRGHVVGSTTAYGWFHDGVHAMRLENHLDGASAGWHVNAATGINADDGIAAIGTVGDGQERHALLLTRVQ